MSFARGRADYLALGDFNARCSMCQNKRKASTMVRNWQGLYRCPEHDEPRQPQDFVRNVKDDMSIPWGQNPAPSFTSYCSLNGMSAVPGYAQAGCMIPGRSFFLLPTGDTPYSLLTDPQGNIVLDPFTGKGILVPLNYPESPTNV